MKISKLNFKLNLIIFILALLPIAALFYPGLPITHDGQDHVARIANFYQNLAEGNIIPRWAANLNWGYGHPIIQFLYPLPSYIASFFHFIGFSLVDSTKIVFGLGMVLSFSFMYLWLSQFLSRLSSLFGAVLYTYAPYRFVELYVRGDLGENLAFAFVPLTLYFLYKFYKQKKFTDTIWASVSLALLILAHNAISLMLLPFILFYSILLFYFSKDKSNTFINYLFAWAMGFGLSAFFWIPGLFEGKYTLRNIVTAGEYISRFVNLKDLLYSPWSFGGSGQFTVQLGPVHWLAFLSSPYIYFRSKGLEKPMILSLIFLTLLSIFIMLPLSDFIWSRFIILQNFQFPWRFLAIIVFTTSVFGALLLEIFSQKMKIILGIIAIIFIVLVSIPYAIPKDYLNKPESFFKNIYNSTTDTGESAPIWSIRFMEKAPPSNLEIVDGEAKVEEITRRSTYHKYKIKVEKKTIFRENTLYFPGWEIKANGRQVDVDFHTRGYNGVMKFSLDKGEYLVETVFAETKLRLFADVISFVSFGNIIGGLVIYLAKSRFVKK